MAPHTVCNSSLEMLVSYGLYVYTYRSSNHDSIVDLSSCFIAPSSALSAGDVVLV